MHVNNVSNAFLPSDSPSSVPCKAVCLERGTHVDHILHPLPKHVNRDGVNIRKWVVDKCQRAEFGFISYAPNPAIIYYISETGHRKLFLVIYATSISRLSNEPQEKRSTLVVCCRERNTPTGNSRILDTISKCEMRSPMRF